MQHEPGRKSIMGVSPVLVLTHFHDIGHEAQGIPNGHFDSRAARSLVRAAKGGTVAQIPGLHIELCLRDQTVSSNLDLILGPGATVREIKRLRAAKKEIGQN